MAESLATHNEALETQISLLAQTHLGTSLEKYVNIVITSTKKQIENPKESDNEVEKSYGKKGVVIKKNPLTPTKWEVVKEVEKEAPYVVPHPYNPPIPFPHRFMEAKVDSQSKRYVEVLEDIHTNTSLSKGLHEKRKLEDHETRELISVKRGRLNFDVVDERIEAKPEKLILKIEQEPPPTN
ncbi:uncharacterized protein LOC127079679 [Lathyrus oleraceus]|uniref:uncharacterized protein LOC127079679 n=1 Tax=Pisum sativum TaxID=3888 RepID=UPI0021D19759|nr:uncharacterized protein LOC127079679 [Pisum sativum]